MKVGQSHRVYRWHSLDSHQDRLQRLSLKESTKSRLGTWHKQWKMAGWSTCIHLKGTFWASISWLEAYVISEMHMPLLHSSGNTLWWWSQKYKLLVTLRWLSEVTLKGWLMRYDWNRAEGAHKFAQGARWVVRGSDTSLSREIDIQSGSWQYV